MTPAERNRGYNRRLQQSRDKLRLVAPEAAGIIAAAARAQARPAETGEALIEIVETATRIWNLSQVGFNGRDAA